MVDFICNGLLELWKRDSSENFKFLPTAGFEQGIFRLRSDHANDYTTKSDIHRAS